jgi:hypothetical protein
MEGYAKLASLMGAYPEVAIVRRFAALNAQNILYLQAELVNLESRLRLVEEEDRNSGDPSRVDCAVDWFKLSNAVNVVSMSGSQPGSCRSSIREDVKTPKTDDHENGESSGRRWKLVLQIRERLKDYSTSPCSLSPLKYGNETKSIDSQMKQYCSKTLLLNCKSPIQEISSFSPAGWNGQIWATSYLKAKTATCGRSPIDLI